MALYDKISENPASKMLDFLFKIVMLPVVASILSIKFCLEKMATAAPFAQFLLVLTFDWFLTKKACLQILIILP